MSVIQNAINIANGFGIIFVNFFGRSLEFSIAPICYSNSTF